MTKEQMFLEKYGYSFESLSKIFYCPYYLEKYKDIIYEKDSVTDHWLDRLSAIVSPMEAILEYKEYFKSLVETEVAVAIIDMQIALNSVSRKHARELREYIDIFFNKVQIEFEDNFKRKRTKKEIKGYLKYSENSTVLEIIEKMFTS